MCKASALPTDQLPHLYAVGQSIPPEEMSTATLFQGKIKAIEEARDLHHLCETARVVGMRTENLQTMEKLKEKLLEYIKEKRQESVKTFEVISEAGRADEYKRKELLNLYEEAKKILNLLDDEFLNPLETSLGDIKMALKENMRCLAPRDHYVVIVAGETSAGKSSVINLILGENILPTSVLSTTSTIFELKYGTSPKIRIHFNDSRKPVYNELDDSKENILTQLTNLVTGNNDREKVSPYKKVELFWPHCLFKERVIIVDTPGVGDSEAMNEVALNYLPNAFCFIYVINSTNAGGVQEDRLGMLLSHAESLKREAKMDLKLFASCALFVCNKWDRIETHEVEEVKLEQIKRLTKKLCGLDPNLQIVYLSCKGAQMAQEYGVIRSDFDDLIRGLSSLLVSSMQGNLDIYTRWLDDLLSRVSRQMTLLLRSTTLSRLEKDKKMADVKKRMKELERSQNETIEELGQNQTQLIWEITGKLAFHFKATDTSALFCKWSPTEVPLPKATWEETENEILRSISERSYQFVQKWEDEEHEFAEAQNKMIKDLCKKYNFMEEEIRKVEDEVLFVDGTAEVFQPEKSTNTLRQTQERFQNVPIASRSHVWLRQGLASVVIRSPLSKLVSKLKGKRNFPRKIKEYETDRCAYMSERCRVCLEVLSDQNRLFPFINEQLEDSVLFLNQIKEKIPKLIEGDKQLYQQLLSDRRNKADILSCYEPKRENLESLMGDVAIYATKEIMRSDFIPKDLKWTEDCKSIIGSGSFSTVYAGVLTRKEGKEVKVALKVYTDLLSKENVRQFWDEGMIMRQVRGHPSIVEFYGTDLLRGPEGTKVVMVSELCKDSIEKLIFSKSDHTPLPTRNKVLCWAVQIVDALHFIHGKELSHQHLKLKNVMLTQEENVKLKGIGRGSFPMNKEIEEDNPRYLAPEVLESEGRNYDSKSDMFSFSILLWELWYCEMAFQTSITSHRQHLRRLKEGVRPTDIEGREPPWPVWKDVMEACWRGEPSNRSTAQQSLNKLRELESVRSKTLPDIPTPPETPPPTPPPRPSRRSKRRRSTP